MPTSCAGYLHSISFLATGWGNLSLFDINHFAPFRHEASICTLDLSLTDVFHLTEITTWRGWLVGEMEPADGRYLIPQQDAVL